MLKAKLGKEEAEAFVEILEKKVDRKFEEAKDSYLTKLEFGKLLLYEEFFDSIDNNYFFIEKENILKESKYIFYGINKLYEIIIKKLL